jgi:hypothetical protein
VGWTPAPATRSRLYAALAGTFFLLAVGTAAGKALLLQQPFDLPVSDGRYYYAYLPAVVVHGNLDFAPLMVDHWGADYQPGLLEHRTETGLVRNKYSIGLALTLLPGFLLGHLLALASGGAIAVNGYTWPYQLASLAVIELLIWRTLLQADRLMTERLRIPARATLVGLLLFAVGTPYAYYACREPFMVHVVSAFWCMEVAAAVSAAQRGPAWLWPRLAFAGAMAVVCRPTNLHLLPLAVYGVAQTVRAAGCGRTMLLFPLAATALVPIGLQLLSWHVLSGKWLYYSYAGEGFHWAHPALWQTLFSSRHGLFFWSPTLLAAALALWRRGQEALVRCWMLGFALLWYANSAWHCWWFGDAFGGRAFLELAGLFGIGLGLLVDRLRTKPRLLIALVSVVVVCNALLLFLYVTHRIPRGGYLWS